MPHFDPTINFGTIILGITSIMSMIAIWIKLLQVVSSIEGRLKVMEEKLDVLFTWWRRRMDRMEGGQG